MTHQPLPHKKTVFLTLGELGPGNNIGLLAAKTCATGIRGQYYGIAAATGKIGAFVGTWVFPYIQAAGGGGDSSNTSSAQYPFYVSSSLCLLAAALTLLCVPDVRQDTIAAEDQRFRAFLDQSGWDTRRLGLRRRDSTAADVEAVEAVRVPGRGSDAGSDAGGVGAPRSRRAASSVGRADADEKKK